MNMNPQVVKQIVDMSHSKVNNYIVPGLYSSLLTPITENGCIRLFESSRDHQEAIIPHSHRFDFSCLVLEGEVTNRVWKSCDKNSGDSFVVSRLSYLDEMGKYEKSTLCTLNFYSEDFVYKSGDWYSMEAKDIHSIYFSKGAKVLFFEGKSIYKSTTILEPFVDGKHIETFETKPWMFEKE